MSAVLQKPYWKKINFFIGRWYDMLKLIEVD